MSMILKFLTFYNHICNNKKKCCRDIYHFCLLEFKWTLLIEVQPDYSNVLDQYTIKATLYVHNRGVDKGTLIHISNKIYIC